MQVAINSPKIKKCRYFRHSKKERSYSAKKHDNDIIFPHAVIFKTYLTKWNTMTGKSVTVIVTLNNVYFNTHVKRHTHFV